MTLIQSLILALHVLVAICVIGFVLLQHGKGADMGAAFGGGSSGSLFGAAGSANFLSRTTAVLATLFFATSIALTWFGSREATPRGVMDQGVMGRASSPAAPADVPQPAAKGTAAAGNAVGAPAGGTVPATSGGSAPVPGGSVPAPAPGQGEVPK
ncbi:MAG: preprotein translocase subunit SecG [Betaproteobacteria bacterium]|nr:preprotein translocase subunit SecG [Betaproteobacteria bacterium]MDE2002499.1 preprotein translocase subunit SecG [Betaproteobacteria bacterium]MDE2208644.1 preprotein translocase subunit SecG [Betaproteobacteria bacterium]MDE2360680.1 preprotein translocase subunit SecG [Betaproteobacteria bacterium]